MPIRQPVYLDIDLLQNVADYLGIDYPVEEKVRELGSRERSGGLSAAVPGTGIGGTLGRGTTNEFERTYEVPVRPIKIFNDALDFALQNEEIKDFTGAHPDWAVVRRDLIQIEGTPAVSDITSAGDLLSKILPAMVPTLAEGRQDGPPPELIAALFDSSSVRPLLYEFDSDSPVPVFLHLDSTWFHRNASPDDVSGDVTVMGIVDQLIPEGQSLDLVRYLLSGVNRAARRAMEPAKLLDLLEKMGRKDAQLSEPGPAWLVRPIAIY
jgi:hypothetical protein